MRDNNIKINATLAFCSPQLPNLLPRSTRLTVQKYIQKGLNRASQLADNDLFKIIHSSKSEKHGRTNYKWGSLKILKTKTNLQA